MTDGAVPPEANSPSVPPTAGSPSAPPTADDPAGHAPGPFPEPDPTAGPDPAPDRLPAAPRPPVDVGPRRGLRPALAALAAVALAALAGWMFHPVFVPGTLVVPVLAAATAVWVTHELVLRLPLPSALRSTADPLLSLVVGLLALVQTTLADSTRSGLPTARTGTALWHGAVDSWAVTLDSLWPVPGGPDRMLFVPLLVLVTAVVTTLLVERWPVLALLPGTLLAGLAQTWTPATGWVAAGYAAAFGASAVVLLAARPGPGYGVPHLDRSGPRAPVFPRAVDLARSVGVLLLAVVLGAVATGMLTVLDRAPFSVKERHEAAVLPAVTTSPLDEIDSRLRAPERVVFTVTTTAPVDRWPLAVLDTFDGRNWTSGEEYQPLGAELPADPGVTVPRSSHTAEISVVDLAGPWLVGQNRVTEVTGVMPLAAPVNGSLVSGRTAAGLTYRLRWTAPTVNRADLVRARLDRVPVPPLPAVGPELTALARRLAGSPTPSVATALRLESGLRWEYRLATGDDLPTGNALPQIRDFLTTTRRGTSEQFACAYVVLARTLGIPARLVVGFRRPPSPGMGTSYAVQNRDVLAWPEIRVAGYGWVPLDPTGSTQGLTSQSPPLLTPPAPAPGTSPRPTPSATPPRPAAGARPGTRPTPHPEHDGIPLALVLLAPVALVVLAWPVGVPVAKALRRRRRRTAPPARAVAGAWWEARDRLADHGLAVTPGTTPGDLATAGRQLLGTQDSLRLLQLGRCVDRAVWSGREPTTAQATQAWQEVDAVRAALAGRPRRARIRAALDVRSVLPARFRFRNRTRTGSP